MPGTITDYVNTHPGLEQKGPANRFLIAGATEGADAFFSTTELCQMVERQCLGIIDPSTGGAPGSLSGGTSASWAYWTASYDTGGTGAWSAGNYLLSTAATNNNKIVLQAVGLPLPSSYVGSIIGGQLVGIVLKKSKILFPANIATSQPKYVIGLGNTTTDPFGTPLTDGVWISLSYSAGNLLVSTNVRGASGTVATNSNYLLSTGVLGQIAVAPGATVTFDLKFVRASAASNLSWGEFWVMVSGQAPLKIPFTAAQIVQLVSQSASVSLVQAVQTTAGATAATLSVDACYGEYDQLL